MPRNRNTAEFLGIREGLNNPSIDPVEFDGIALRQMQVLTGATAIQQLNASPEFAT